MEQQPTPSPTKGDEDLVFDNLPNRLTLFRIALVPFVVLCLYLQKSSWSLFSDIAYKKNLGLVAGGLFLLASITDYFDGFIARRRNQVTIFGSLLDPIADKFLTVSAMIMLNYLDRLPVLLLVILVLREFYMTSLRLLASTEGLSVPVDDLGKWKTALQMAGIPTLMMDLHWNSFSFNLLGDICIYISAILSLSSSVGYSVGLIGRLKKNRLEKKRLRDLSGRP